MLNKLQHGTPFAVAVSHATSAVASQAAVAGSVHYITDIAGSSDKAGSLLTVKQGTTVVFEVQLATTAAGINAFEHTFASPIPSAVNALVSVTVDGTSLCKANIGGFTI